MIGRFAPTPSGRMHLGNVFSALLAWLSVRSQAGQLVLRIEDLDPRARDRDRARQLMDDLRWLGLDWDEGPYYQSERTEVYREAIARLDGMGLTYPCFCTRSELHAASAPHASDGTYVYPGTCRHLSAEERARRASRRSPATRLMVPAVDDPRGRIEIDDAVWGPFRQNLARDCGDFLVRRSDGIVAYQLAVVVDDGLMGITEVVRGHDLLASSPRQVYLQRLLGFPEPAYAHVPLLLSPDRRRLSKRDHDLDLGELRSWLDGPERLVSALGRLVGLAEPGELLSAEDLIARFSWQKVHAHRQDIVIGPDFLHNLTL